MNYFSLFSLFMALLVASASYAVTPVCPSSLDKAALSTLSAEETEFDWRGVKYKTDNRSMIKSGLKGWSSAFMDPWAETFGKSFQDIEGKKASINCNYAYVSGLLSWGYYKAKNPYIVQLIHTPDMGSSLPLIKLEEYNEAREFLGFADAVYKLKLIEPEELAQRYSERMAPLNETINGNAKTSDKKDARVQAQRISDAYDTVRFYVGRHME